MERNANTATAAGCALIVDIAVPEAAATCSQ